MTTPSRPGGGGPDPGLSTIISERDAIASPGAWLTTVTSRICLDLLGSARARRERYVGEWIPEPLPEPAEWISGQSGGSTADPADRVTLDDDDGLTRAARHLKQAVTARGLPPRRNALTELFLPLVIPAPRARSGSVKSTPGSLAKYTFNISLARRSSRVHPLCVEISLAASGAAPLIHS